MIINHINIFETMNQKKKSYLKRNSAEKFKEVYMGTLRIREIVTTYHKMCQEWKEENTVCI